MEQTDKDIEQVLSVWRPRSPKQVALLKCPVKEVFFGGARGGGKTDGVLGKYLIKALRYGSGFNGLFFRRELPMADDAIERSKEFYPLVGAKFNEARYLWRFPNGARMRFRPLERVEDADKYQGQNVSDVAVEEMGQYPDPAPIDRLHGILRSAKGVPTQLIGTGNPGGAGQFWCAQRYINPAPLGFQLLRETLPNGKYHHRFFIPSSVHDNTILMEKDPEYIDRLYLVGSPQLVEAWLKGKWDAVEGAFFDCFSTEKHVVRPFPIPSHWYKFRAADWGSARPFAVLWGAVATDDTPLPSGHVIPRGALIVYREWYGWNGKPNTGLKMTAEEVGLGIKEREKDDVGLNGGVLDPAAFAQDGGPSIADRIAGEGVYFTQADNKRVTGTKGGTLGPLGGWDTLRNRLLGLGPSRDARGHVTAGTPMIYIFSTCTQLLRTLPVLQHDTKRPEDLDTESEDHLADALRYMCMSRPWIAEAPKQETPGRTYRPMVNQESQSWRM